MTTDNTQELDEIINNLSGKYSGSIASAMLAGGSPEETIFMMDKYGKEAKQALLDWHNKQIEALLDEMLVDVSSPSANIDQAEMIELINLYINKLRAESRQR